MRQPLFGYIIHGYLFSVAIHFRYADSAEDFETRIGMTYIEKTKIISGKIASDYCEQLQIKSKK